jgi:hypothetical protein
MLNVFLMSSLLCTTIRNGGFHPNLQFLQICYFISIGVDLHLCLVKGIFDVIVAL